MSPAAALVAALAIAAPAAPPGAPSGEPRRELTFELSAPPATHWGPAARVEADRDLAALVAGLPRVRYDAALARAAREVARFHRREKQIAPSGVLAFLLAAAGAAEWGVQQVVMGVDPGSRGDLAVRETVRELAQALPAGSPPARVGLGEVTEDGSSPPLRHVAILLSASGLEIDPVATRAEPDASVEVRFRLPPGWDRPEVLTLTPGLDFATVAVAAAEPGYRAVVATGPLPGTLFIEVVATGPAGPAPLAQLEIHVGEPPPTAYRGTWPADESRLKRYEQAADLVYTLLSADRAARGLPALARDPALDRIARGHSRDMRDRGLVGHVSPVTGGPADRLAAARYRSIAYAENIARDGSLYEAEGRLLASLGHRKNILSTQLTRVGVGVALAAEENSRLWYVTQLFARPAPVIDRAAARREAIAAIDRARLARGLRLLRPDAELTKVAQAEAERAAPAPNRVLDALRDSRHREGTYWSGVIELPEMEQFAVPEPVLAPGYGRIGVGVHQDRASASPEITLVLLAGE